MLKDKHTLMLFGLLAITFISLAIIGGMRAYSPVPFWDMVDGYLDFFTKVSAGDLNAWWFQHNEHRIVLARALFWIDLAWFQGMGWFLIVVNYLLMGVVYWFFHMSLNELSAETDAFTRKLLSLLILILLFSWIQKDNLTWGFQSQFILAQLLPLIAFFLLHQAFAKQNASNSLFFLACLTGVISLGSMANGVMTLPLMTLLALVLRMKWQRIAVLAILAVITTTLYFYDYHPPGYHGSITEALVTNPGGLIKYVLLYIGGPFYYMTGKGSHVIAQLAGFFLIASAVFFTWRYANKPASASLQLALLTFLLYIGGTALATGGGRLIFGVEQALSGRYQTPALMAWAALLVLYAPVIHKGVRKYPIRVIFSLLLVPLLLVSQQVKAVRSQQSTLFERQVAALSLELGIEDEQQISSIYPNTKAALLIVKIPVERNLSFFGHPLIKNANQLIGQVIKNRSEIQCQGSLDMISRIEGDGKYVRIRGWLYQTDVKTRPSLIHLLNGEGRVIGYALTGQPRPDIETAIDPRAAESGFKGYLLENQLGKTIILRGFQPDCELKIEAPLIPYIMKKTKFGNGVISTHQDQVVGLNEWTGSDFYRSNLKV